MRRYQMEWHRVTWRRRALKLLTRRYSKVSTEMVANAATVRPQGRASWTEEAGANLHLALPIAIAFLAQMATIFVDNVMVGRLGAAELAAGGLGSNMMISPMLL